MNDHLDHTGLVVADLQLAAQHMRALGFNMSPSSRHTVPNIDGSLRFAGTENQCAMLRRGYIELVSVVDPTAESFSNTEIGGFLARFAGLHLLAIATRDADQTEARLNSARRRRVEVRALHRKIETRDGPQDATFRLVVVPELSGPDITFFFIEHKTPDLLWTPQSMVHPNGATALHEILVVADDLCTARESYESTFGRDAVAYEDYLAFELDQSRLLVMTPEAATLHYGMPIPIHTRPHCAGQTVRVAELAATKAVLEANSVPFVETPSRLTVEPRYACGGFLQFTEET